MRIKLTRHGIERLFERVQRKAQEKNYSTAMGYINKVIEKGIVTANDAKQMLVLHANNLYIFKKEIVESIEHCVFVTVKTSQETRLGVYIHGERRTFMTKKNFQLCA